MKKAQLPQPLLGPTAFLPVPVSLGPPRRGRSHSDPLPRTAAEWPLPSRWLEQNGLIQRPLMLRSSPRKPDGTQLECVQL